MWSSESGCATVTWAVTSPRALATEALKARVMSRTAKSRRFFATSLMKLAASPPMPARSRMADTALVCSSDGEDRAAHEPAEVVAPGDHRLETVEVGGDGIDGPLVARELEQGGGVTPSHAGYDRFFPCHRGVTLASTVTGLRSDRARAT